MITVCIRDSNTVFGIFLWNDIKTMGIITNADTCLFLIELFYKMEDSEKVSELVSLMGTSGLFQSHPGAYSRLLVISKTVGDTGMFDRILAEMEHAGVAMNEFQFNTVVCYFAENGKLDDFLRIYEKGRRIGVVFNQFTFDRLIYLFGRAGNIQSMEEFLGKMIHGGFKPSLPTINSLIFAYGSVNMSERSYRSISDAYVKLGETEKFQEVFEVMIKSPYAPDMKLCAAMIDACTSLSDLNRIKKICIKLGPSLSQTLFNKIIDLHFNSSDSASCETLYQEMILAGLKPDHRSLLHILEINGKSGRLKEMQEVMMILCSFEKLPRVAFTVIIAAYAESGNLERMQQMFLDMIQSGFEADAHIYKVMIVSSHKFAQLWRISLYYNEMIQVGIKPEAETCNLLQDYFSQEGDVIKVKRVYEHVKAGDIKLAEEYMWFKLVNSLNF